MDFETLKNRVTELAQGGVSKAKELMEIGKLKVNNATEADAIRKAYTEIGKLYFAERGMDPEAPYSALCEKIAASKAKIDYNQERINDLKAAGAPVDVESEDICAEEGFECPCCTDNAPAEEAPVEETPAEEAPAEDEPKE